MPTRVIRDGVLDSQRYHDVDKPARLAFLEMLLCCDDYGLVPLSGVFLKRRTTAFEGIPQAGADALLSALVDADLIRIYDVEGARFAYIPRFGNTPRAKKPKYPLPPDALGGNEIKHLVEKLHGKRSADVVHLPANVLETVYETETVSEEETDKLSLVSARPAETAVPDCPHLEVLKLWNEVLPALPSHKPALWRGARADHLRARWRETAVEKGWKTKADGLAFLRRLFGYVGRSAFLSGKTRPREGARPFVCELEWLVSPQNWAKVIEGKYHPEKA